MESSFIFTTPLSIDAVEKKDGEDIYLEGYVSTKDKDLVNDIITTKCLKSMQRQILEGNIKLDIEHEAFRGATNEEKELNKTKIPRGRLIDATNDKTGLRVKGILNKFHSGFEEVKGSLVNNFLNAMSIAFIPTEIKNVEVNGEQVRLLDDLRLLNVALTGNPVNTQAQIVEVFTKSIDSLEDYQKAKSEEPNKNLGLEVKTSPKERRTQARNEAISEDEDEDETKKKKKSNSLRETNTVKKEEEKEMVENKENPEEEEAQVEAPKEEPSESNENPEAPAEKQEAEANTEAIDEMKSKIDELEKEVKDLKEIKAEKVEANHKAIVENKDEIKASPVSPLDVIR